MDEKIVKVIWSDSVCSNEWMKKEDSKKLILPQCITIGFLHSSSDTEIEIVACKSTTANAISSVWKIPKGAILSMEELEVKNVTNS